MFSGKRLIDRIDSRVDTFKHIQTVQKYMLRCISQLIERQRVHDQSKLVSPEVEIFDEYTPKLKESTYGSDEYKTFLVGMRVGLDHHYLVNSHHPEHCAFENGEVNQELVRNGTAISRMNLLDLVELVTDWMAAVERHDTGNIEESIEINQKRFGYDDQLKSIIRNTVHIIQEDVQKSSDTS